jgi:hypothetical protein
MAKAQALAAGTDLADRKRIPIGTTRQRGVMPSDELVPIQFRMSPEFVQAFKQAALDRKLKLNEMLKVVFQHFMKTS